MTHEDQRTTTTGNIREDIFTTLAIAALLHDDNRTIQEVAATLAKRAPGSLRKNTLLPLSQSTQAHAIIMDSAVFPIDEKVIGSAEYAGEQYTIVAQWRHVLDYTINEVLGAVADVLIQRGFLADRVYVTVIDPVYRGTKSDSVLLASHAKYSVQNYGGIQLEA